MCPAHPCIALTRASPPCRYKAAVEALQTHYGTTDKCIPHLLPVAAYQCALGSRTFLSRFQPRACVTCTLGACRHGWRCISTVRQDSAAAFNHLWYAPASFGIKGETKASDITTGWLRDKDPR